MFGLSVIHHAQGYIAHCLQGGYKDEIATLFTINAVQPEVSSQYHLPSLYHEIISQDSVSVCNIQRGQTHGPCIIFEGMHEVSRTKWMIDSLACRQTSPTNVAEHFRSRLCRLLKSFASNGLHRTKHSKH